jgi:hypothetical protein
MNYTTTSIWDATGFRVAPPPNVYAAKIGNTPVLPLEFESLNPQVRFTQCMTRWELLRTGLWFVRQSFRQWK